MLTTEKMSSCATRRVSLAVLVAASAAACAVQSPEDDSEVQAHLLAQLQQSVTATYAADAGDAGDTGDASDAADVPDDGPASGDTSSGAAVSMVVAVGRPCVADVPRCSASTLPMCTPVTHQVSCGRAPPDTNCSDLTVTVSSPVACARGTVCTPSPAVTVSCSPVGRFGCQATILDSCGVGTDGLCRATMRTVACGARASEGAACGLIRAPNSCIWIPTTCVPTGVANTAYPCTDGPATPV